MSRRVCWLAFGVGFEPSLYGEAEVTPRDVLAVTAALRDFQKRAGFEVVALRRVRSEMGLKTYSVRVRRPGMRPTSCIFLVEPVEDGPGLRHLESTATA